MEKIMIVQEKAKSFLGQNGATVYVAELELRKIDLSTLARQKFYVCLEVNGETRTYVTSAKSYYKSVKDRYKKKAAGSSPETKLEEFQSAEEAAASPNAVYYQIAERLVADLMVIPEA